MQPRWIREHFTKAQRRPEVNDYKLLLICRKIKELPFDHVYNPTTEAESAVLYADIQNEIFKDFHSVLKKAAEDGVIRYILRYRPVTGFSMTRPLKDKPLFVAGYGVELMLKKTDYIVIDDREVEAGTSSMIH